MALASVKAGPGSIPSGFWFRSVTQGAAELLGWRNVGRLAPGFEADIAVLEPDPLEWEELAMASDPLRFALELPWPSRVRSVYSAGRLLLGDGEFPTLPSLPGSLSRERADLAGRAMLLPSGA
jgi:cytosine/adenosine deaminase-related metal-dependent hydrolase